MSRKITDRFQGFAKIWIGPLLTIGLLSACADSLDQTDADISSPGAGLVRLGDQIRAHGDDEGAMDFYARAVQRAPGDKSARRKLGELLEAHNDYQDAADQYAALVKLAPDNAEYHRDYGRLLLKQNKAVEAKDEYEAALKIDHEDIRALNGLGVTLDLLGDHEAARTQYQTALQQAPEDLVTLNNLGHSYILSGNYDETIKLLEPQYQNPAVPPTLRQNLAEAYSMSGMDVDAERVLRQDLPPDQIKKRIAHYHGLRDKITAPPLYANLGSFTTPELAQARIDKVKEQFAKELKGLTVSVVSKIDEAGGTPDFFAHVSGFKDLAAAKAFCDRLLKGGTFCRARSG